MGRKKDMYMVNKKYYIAVSKDPKKACTNKGLDLTPEGHHLEC